MARNNNKSVRRLIESEEDEPFNGGVWKLAYADFVTALMAFFLLLWLLGTSNQTGLRGVSEYFNTPSKVSSKGGDAPGSVVSDTDSKGFASMMANSNQDFSTLERTQRAWAAALIEREEMVFEKAIEQIQQNINEGKLSEFKDQLSTELTVDGLVIQLMDLKDKPMFRSGSAEPLPQVIALLGVVADVINQSEQAVAVYGHTDSTPYSANGARSYSNWELSADRANRVRQELQIKGVKETRFLQVSGYAASKPLLADNPSDAQNRRVEIALLRAGASQLSNTQALKHSTGGLELPGKPTARTPPNKNTTFEALGQ